MEQSGPVEFFVVPKQWKCSHPKREDMRRYIYRDHSRFGFGQWEKALHRNASCHWLSAYQNDPPIQNVFSLVGTVLTKGRYHKQPWWTQMWSMVNITRCFGSRNWKTNKLKEIMNLSNDRNCCQTLFLSYYITFISPIRYQRVWSTLVE